MLQVGRGLVGEGGYTQESQESGKLQVRLQAGHERREGSTGSRWSAEALCARRGVHLGLRAQCGERQDISGERVQCSFSWRRNEEGTLGCPRAGEDE